jgi:predicted nucleic acid-binding protein
MAASVIVDTSFLVTLLNRDEKNHRWADAVARRHAPPWSTCEAVISETFHLLSSDRVDAFAALMRRGAIMAPFRFDTSTDDVLDLMHKYADVPMSFADACLVRMTEVLPDPVLLTTDIDFRIYRRLGRQVVPCMMPR